MKQILLAIAVILLGTCSCSSTDNAGVHWTVDGVRHSFSWGPGQ